MGEPIKPRALTYTEMMNGGRQQMDEAEHAREQQLNSGSKPCRRTLIGLRNHLRAVSKAPVRDCG